MQLRFNQILQNFLENLKNIRETSTIKMRIFEIDTAKETMFFQMINNDYIFT